MYCMGSLFIDFVQVLIKTTILGIALAGLVQCKQCRAVGYSVTGRLWLKLGRGFNPTCGHVAFH